jgi:pimeloyl-ACP methyl ester carboxylesterase
MKLQFKCRYKAAHLGAIVTTAIAIAACQQSPRIDAAAAATPRTLMANGYAIPYVEQGHGEPVLFVHGAVGDFRTWDRQRATLAGRYRTISYTQRYFGAPQWGADWPKFTEQAHADDLVAFIRALGMGPVHLVAWSYSGHIALAAALQHPELVKSAFVFEPAAPTYVTNPEDLKAIGEDAAAFGSTVKAVQSGNNAEAVRQLIDMVGERTGYFDAQPAAVRAIQLDSARSMALLMGHQTQPQITCEQLGQIRVPVAIVRGGEVRPFFRIIADAAMRCIPGGRHQVVPSAKHMWPGEQPAAFGESVAAFIAGQVH